MKKEKKKTNEHFLTMHSDQFAIELETKCKEKQWKRFWNQKLFSNQNKCKKKMFFSCIDYAIWYSNAFA